MNNLPPMSDDMKYNGVTLLHLIGNDKDTDLEEWCQKIARLSGQQVDWFTCAGRDGVKALGDIDKVMQIMEKHIHELCDTPIRFGPLI